MLQQEITIKVNVPAGYELTGEYRVPNDDELWLMVNDEVAPLAAPRPFQQRFILRKAWEAPACFPDGAWVYLNSYLRKWVVTNKEPSFCWNGWQQSVGADHAACISAEDIIKLHGLDIFTPPPVDCIQVKR